MPRNAFRVTRRLSFLAGMLLGGFVVRLLCYTITPRVSTHRTPRARPERGLVPCQCNVSNRPCQSKCPDLHVNRSLPQTKTSEDTIEPPQPQHRATVLKGGVNHTLLWHLHHSVRRASSPPMHTRELSMGRSDDFGLVMRNAGIPLFLLSGEEPATHDWVQYAASWWRTAGKWVIDAQTLKDLENSPPHKPEYYRSLARNFLNGSYVEAVQFLSAFPGGKDAWPGVAVIENAVIFRDGQVHNASHLVNGKGACRGSFPRMMPQNEKNVQNFGIVGTIAEYWSSAYFHFVAESYLRVVLFLDVLEHFEESKLHVHSKGVFVTQLLAVIGIQQRRIVDGVVSADFALYPEPIPCGTPPAVLLNRMRHTLLQKSNDLGSIPPPDSCTIILVRRRGKREISNHADFFREIAKTFSTCEVHVHTGDGDLISQLVLFRSATVVVAPHGAGLVNIIVCRENTLIFELLVSGKHVNLCYMSMACKLRLRYTAMTVAGSTQDGAMTVNVPSAVAFLKVYSVLAANSSTGGRSSN